MYHAYMVQKKSVSVQFVKQSVSGRSRAPFGGEGVLKSFEINELFLLDCPKIEKFSNLKTSF